MADDNHARYRPSDSYGRRDAAPDSDPLAELARLIGRGEGMSGSGRPAHSPTLRFGAAPPYEAERPYDRDEPHHDAALPQDEADPHYADDSAAGNVWHNGGVEPSSHLAEDQFDQPQAYARDDGGYDRQPYDSRDNAYDNRDYAPPQAYDDRLRPPHLDTGRHDAAYDGPPQGYASRHDPALHASPDYAQDHAAPHYAGEPYVDEHDARQDYAAQGYAAQSYAAQDEAEPDYSQRLRSEQDYSPASLYQPHPPRLYPQEPGVGAMPPPHSDEFYEDEGATGGRRRSLMTVVAVLALAVLGTAAAFGYRSLFGGPAAPAVPPVIHASNEPVKVAPPPAPDQTATKFTYDRFSDAGKDEQVVSREEKPLDLSKIRPPAVATARAQDTAATATAPSAIGDPRRVRTVPIRPNSADVASVAPMTGPASIAPQNLVPAASEPPATQPAAAPPHADSRAAPTRSVRTTKVPAAANAPLSLSPNANNAPPAAAPRESAPKPAPRVASTASSGGYLVQVSSQKSEADAESAYRGISAKYAGVIGGKPHTVRRADLGNRGIYYRAMVGPFASRDEAVSVCASLKQAGGDCVVQH